MGGAETCEDCLLIGPQCAWCSQEVNNLSMLVKTAVTGSVASADDRSPSVLLPVGKRSETRQERKIELSVGRGVNPVITSKNSLRR